ncbi:hypothetical protein [Allorhizobium borbori]|uniref:Uncharacterized protein n=1 Tax=Allorhizobium borbori TaxID=485907 RepID=A0A7W6K0P5_9HYPH|nr:hypothetical protein [Allorhizobium borbori]MBB4103045.1 hypothetical protein [Allorhizobium borbori]
MTKKTKDEWKFGIVYAGIEIDCQRGFARQHVKSIGFAAFCKTEDDFAAAITTAVNEFSSATVIDLTDPKKVAAMLQAGWMAASRSIPSSPPQIDAPCRDLIEIKEQGE